MVAKNIAYAPIRYKYQIILYYIILFGKKGVAEMENQNFALNEFVLILSVATIFAILFIVIYKILKQISIFKGFTSVVASICVSLLSLIGLSRFFVISDVACETSANRHDITFDFILLPYSALIIAVILVSLLLFVSKVLKNQRTKKQFTECKRMIWR